MTKFYVILFEICVEVVDNRRNIYTDRYEQQIEIRNPRPLSSDIQGYEGSLTTFLPFHSTPIYSSNYL